MNVKWTIDISYESNPKTLPKFEVCRYGPIDYICGWIIISSTGQEP